MFYPLTIFSACRTLLYKKQLLEESEISSVSLFQTPMEWSKTGGRPWLQWPKLNPPGYIAALWILLLSLFGCVNLGTEQALWKCWGWNSEPRACCVLLYHTATLLGPLCLHAVWEMGRTIISPRWLKEHEIIRKCSAWTCKVTIRCWFSFSMTDISCSV